MSDVGFYICCNAEILTYLHHWLLVSLEQFMVIVDLQFQA